MASYNGLTKIQMHARLTTAHSGPGSLQTYDLVDSRAAHKIELDSQNPNKLLIKNYASTTLGSIDLPITTIAVEEIQFDGTNEDFYLPSGTSLPEMGKGKLYIITGGGGDTGTHPYTFRPNNNYSIYYGDTPVDYVCTTKRYLVYIVKDTLTHYNIYFLSYPCYETGQVGTNPVNTEAKLNKYIASLGMVKNEHSENTTSFFKMYGTEYDAEDDPHEAEITISQKTYFYVDGHYITICTNTNEFADVPVDKIVLNTDHDTNFNRIISAEIAVECGFDQKPYRLFTTDGTTYPISSPGIQSASYVVIIGRYYKL